MPKVSVIMGVYNCAGTVGTAIESILAQTYTDWEYIICDDASTDHTLEVLREYEAQDARVHVIVNEHNSRLAASLNHCLQYAKGEYIARMDGDDRSAPDRLEKQVAFLDVHPEYEVVGSQMMAFDDSGDIGIHPAVEAPDRYTMRYVTPFTHATILMRKSAYDALEGYRVCRQTRRCEDADLWFRFFAQGFSGYNLQEPLYWVRDDLQAFERRKLKYGIDLLEVCWWGYRQLRYPLRYYPYLLKPLVSSMMPAGIMKIYHKIRMDQRRDT